MRDYNKILSKRNREAFNKCEGRTVADIMRGNQGKDVTVLIIEFDDGTSFVLEICKELTTASFIEEGEED